MIGKWDLPHHKIQLTKIFRSENDLHSVAKQNYNKYDEI